MENHVVTDQHHQDGNAAQTVDKIIIPVDAGVDVPDIKPVFLWQFGFSDFHEQAVDWYRQTGGPEHRKAFYIPLD